MARTTPSAGTAKLALISDFPIEEKELHAVRRLFGENTTDSDLEFGPNRKTCQWPCRVPYEYEVTSLGFHIFLCAGFLCQKRADVNGIHELGCNLELCITVPRLTGYTSLASATMKQLADLDIQLSFMTLEGCSPQ